METLKYDFDSGAKANIPSYNEQESLSFWSSYDTPSMNIKEENKKDPIREEKATASFGKLLGAVARAGKPDKD